MDSDKGPRHELRKLFKSRMQQAKDDQEAQIRQIAHEKKSMDENLELFSKFITTEALPFLGGKQDFFTKNGAKLDLEVDHQGALCSSLAFILSLNGSLARSSTYAVSYQYGTVRASRSPQLPQAPFRMPSSPKREDIGPTIGMKNGLSVDLLDKILMLAMDDIFGRKG